MLGDEQDLELNPFLIVSGVMTFSTGIFLTGVRFFEPLFRHLALKKVYEFWGVLYEPRTAGHSEEELRAATDSLNSILASSLNVELVYIILKSITAFSRDEFDGQGQTNRDSGLIICQKDSKGIKDKIREIEMDASQVRFEQQTAAEC